MSDYFCLYCRKEVSYLATKCPWCHSDLTSPPLGPEQVRKTLLFLASASGLMIFFILGLWPLSFVCFLFIVVLAVRD